jgi:hypothetical protein
LKIFLKYFWLFFTSFTVQSKYMEESLTCRLRKRAEIRLQIHTRKSVQEGVPDRLAALLIEAADEIDRLNKPIEQPNQGKTDV